MKYPSFLLSKILVVTCLLTACDRSDDASDAFTGRQTAYTMASASEYNIQGTATFREMRGGDLQLTVQLENTVAGGQHPGHLHYGTVDVPGSDMALMLMPVEGATGTSVTTFNQLANGTPFTFDDLMGFDGSIKVHLDGGVNKDVVLAGANIGQNSAALADDIAVCASPSDQ
ncbi:MAG: hypothetical protein WA960_13455 [Tunicatimonas sp.]